MVTLEQAIEQALAAPGMKQAMKHWGMTDPCRAEIRAALANVAQAAAQLERERIVAGAHERETDYEVAEWIRLGAP